MSKNIETIVDDIYKVFNGEHVCSKENLEALSKRIAEKIQYAIERPKNTGKGRLVFSNIGTPCTRKLWYIVNSPEVAKELKPNVKIKFVFGDILEELLLFLAAEAGHDVRGQQKTLEINGVRGKRDAIIDGRLVDVKSASSPSFEKFKRHDLIGNDSFGYIDQLGAYLQASNDESNLQDKDIASFLVIDKQHGHITLDTYPAPDKDYVQDIESKKQIVAQENPPERTIPDEPIGKSGNRGLGTVCSYCDFKYTCWPNLRTFIYSSGPEFLTHVERLPKVIEVNEEGIPIASKESETF